MQSTRDTNGLKYRTSLKNVKESNKIDLEIEFINNGRPFRVNSKRSKMLNKSKNSALPGETYTTFNDIKNGTVVKRLNNSTGPGERVVVRSNEKNAPKSHKFFKADKKENSSGQIKLAGQGTEGSISGMFNHPVGLDNRLISFQNILFLN